MSGRVGVGTLRGVVGVRSIPTEAWVTAPYFGPEGMRVHRTAVLAVRPEGDGWSVETAAGIEHVDAYGEGSRLVPVDEELAAEFEEGGTSFVVLSTVDELEQDLDQSLDWQRFERDLGRDEVDRDYGPER